MYRRRAINRLNKELDIVNFIRKQMKVNVILEKIFPGSHSNRINKHRIFDLVQSVSEESRDEVQNIFATRTRK